jgi:hypothetical protein
MNKLLVEKKDTIIPYFLGLLKFTHWCLLEQSSAENLLLNLNLFN